MDTSNGNLIPGELYNALTDEEKKNYVQAPGATMEQISRGKVGRNEKCPCGTGRKFKYCCLAVKKLF